MEIKKLSDISWNVTEEQYRADPAWSYSTLARYNREGYNGLKHLFDKTESSSLLFGSCVDSIITGGFEEFESRFKVVDLPSTPDSIIQIVKLIYTNCSGKFTSLYRMDEQFIIDAINQYNYQPNWRPDTRVKVVKEKGESYYRSLLEAGDKIIVTSQVYTDVINAVNALKGSDATRYYFADNNPFEDIERYYQLKFKGTFDNIDYRCMADLIIVDHEHKTILPCDLKTSSHKEWDFYQSFMDWGYHIQARLYWRLIRQNMDKDEYFKDFTLLNYNFIVVNKETLTPLVWSFRDTQVMDKSLYYGKECNIECKDPFELGRDLEYYTKHENALPKGIEKDNTNDLVTWLNRL